MHQFTIFPNIILLNQFRIVIFDISRSSNDKVPMNLLSKISEMKQKQEQQQLPAKPVTVSESYNFDLSYLLNTQNGTKSPNKETHDTSDDYLVDITDEKMLEVDKHDDETTVHTVSTVASQDNGDKGQNCTIERSPKSEIKLNNVFVKLESIKPSGLPPMTVLEEKNGVSVTLHLAKDEPKEGVSVYVVTTVSKNEVPMSNYLFQAVVPKVI